MKSARAARPKTGQRLSSDEVHELCLRYKNGDAVSELAKSFGVHSTTVTSHLERNGIVRRGNVRKMTDRDVLAAAEKYTGGMSLAQVAQAHGISAMTVRKELLSAGHLIRPRRGANY